MNEFSWFFACLYILGKVKNYLNSYWVGMIKYVCGLLGHGTLKFFASQEWISEADFLHAHIYSGKLKVTLIVIGSGQICL